jgi:hypothetical protein
VLRKILAVLTGLILAGVAVGVTETIGMELFPPAEGFNPSDPDLSLVPTMAVVSVAIAWLFGPTLGALAATRIAQTADPKPAAVIGVLFLTADVANLVMIPSPAWLWVVGIAAPLLGAALGFRLGRVDGDAVSD